MGLIPDKDKPSIPRQNLEEYNILVYAPPGYGKTSFANAFNDAMLVLFEDSAKAMLSNDINLSQKVEETSYKYEWEIFKDTIKEFMQGKHEYKTLAIDTATRAYPAAMEYMKNTKLNGVHPSVLMNKDDNSSGYTLLNEELQKQFGKILNSNYGTIITAHATRKKIEDMKGTKRHQLIPDTGGSFGSWLMGEVDITILIDKDADDNRVFRIEGKGEYEAKQRLRFEEDEIMVETDKLDAGKYMYNKFKEEFDKALARLNDTLGVTQEMIDQYYNSKQQKKQLQKTKDKIIEHCQNNGISPSENTAEMEEVLGCSSVREIGDLEDAKKYLKHLKNKE